jgi:hypothetical protein
MPIKILCLLLDAVLADLCMGVCGQVLAAGEMVFEGLLRGLVDEIGARVGGTQAKKTVSKAKKTVSRGFVAVRYMGRDCDTCQD